MKTGNLIITLTLCFLITGGLWAQNNTTPLLPQNYQSNGITGPSGPNKTECKTELGELGRLAIENRNTEEFKQLLKRYANPNSRAAIDYILQIHIVRKSDGTGGASIGDIRSEFQNFVNPYFAGIDVSFLECNPENYINSDTYYNLSGDAEGDAMSVANNVDSVINIYYVNDADGACGWARFPWKWPSDYIVIDNGCLDNKSTTVHELGHYFSLLHTHQSGDELVDGSNCLVAGDFLCSTPADPNISSMVTAAPGCVYTGVGTDANGDTYVPNPLLIMSYSTKACRTDFTGEQNTLMLATTVLPEGFGRNYLKTGPCPCDRPVAKCKNINEYLDGSGNGSITASNVDNGSTWDCGFGSWSVSPSSFICSDVGGNGVTLTVTDALGWVSTCSATVTVIDTVSPVITTPASSESHECDGTIGHSGDFATWLAAHGGASATDACGGSWSDNSTGLSDGCGATGSETVTFTYTDPSNNTKSTTATFTIVDTDPPSVTCPANIHLPECDSIATWVVIASDVCGNVTTVSVPPSGSVFAKGTTTTVEVTVTDECGNTSTCNFEVERDPDLVVDIDSVAHSPLNTCAVGTNAHIVLGYGGGPTCVTLTATGSGGHAPYTYAWDAPAVVPGANFTDGNTATPTFCSDFQTDACVSYTFIVTITDFHGCTETNSIDINVVNVGVFADGKACAKPNNPKVVVCHIPPGNPANSHAICISPKGVPAHIDGNPNNGSEGHQADCIGDCDAVCVSVAPAQNPAARQFDPTAGKDNNYTTALRNELELSIAPNPFNFNTVISISSTMDADIELSIFDLSGSIVARLYSGPVKKDVPYYFDFNPENLQSGIYIAKLLGSSGEMKYSKMILIK